MPTMRHKQQKDENFPVASFLFSKDTQKVVTAYYDFARYCDDVADNPALTSQQKLERLEAAEQALFNEKEAKKNKQAAHLRKVFLKENLSFSLAADLLKAFRQDSEGFFYQTWGQLIDYCKNSAAPVGRFMLAINNENPSTYLPADALCAALQIVNHIQDVKYDFQVLKRVYIPDELWKQFNLSESILEQNKSPEAFQKLINEMLKRVKGLLKDAEILPCIVKNLRLRLVLCVIFSLTNIMIYKILKGDVLASQIKLNKFDWARAVLLGIGKGLFIRRKTLTNKGL